MNNLKGWCSGEKITNMLNRRIPAHIGSSTKINMTARLKSYALKLISKKYSQYVSGITDFTFSVRLVAVSIRTVPLPQPRRTATALKNEPNTGTTRKKNGGPDCL